MSTLGMYLSLPWGLLIYVVAVTIVFMVIGIIWWRFMDHLPEDDLNWSDDSRFIYKEDEERNGQ